MKTRFFELLFVVMPVVEILGDLLEAEEQYIVQQCNCATTYAAGLAAGIASKFPHADVYTPGARAARGTMGGDIPGTIAVLGGAACSVEDDRKLRGVINIFGQFTPGKPRRPRQTTPVEYGSIVAPPDVVDDAAQRMEWFEAGLREIAQLDGLESLAFPFQIGCGLAGGDWRVYRRALDKFSDDMGSRSVQVSLYKLPEASWPCVDCRSMASTSGGQFWKKTWYCNACYKTYWHTRGQ